MMTLLETLPNELLQYLFHYLDGISLLKVARVSKRCNSVVHNIIDTPTYWRRRCQNDIPAIIEEELLLHYAYEDDEFAGSCDWKSIYSSWFRSRFIGQWPSITGDIRELNENARSLGHVSHLRFFDDFLLTTHGNANCGLVKLWDTITGEMLATVSRHPPPQRSLNLELLVPWRYRIPRLPRGAEAQNGRRESLAEVIVVSASVEVVVCVLCPASKDARTVFTHRFSSTPTATTTSWGDNFFASVAEDGRGAIYWFEYQDKSFQGRLISTFLCPYRVVESISLWRDLLVTGSGDGTIAVWQLTRAETDEDIILRQEELERQEQHHQQQPPPRQDPAPLRLRLRHDLDDDSKELVLALTYRTRSNITDVFLRGEFVAFLDDDGIFTWLSDIRESVVSKSNLFCLIQCRPSAICLSGSLLAIGDEAGKVSVFDLSSPNSPILVDIFASPSQNSSSSTHAPSYVFRSSSNERIVEIQICDDGHGPTLVVLSGKTNVQIVRFFHPSI